MYQLILYGISHKTAPVHIREKLVLDASSRSYLIAKLKSNKNIHECVVISTCNRTEVCAVTDDENACIRDVRGYFIDKNHVDEKIIDNHFYSFSNVQAVRHLLRVSCSLDSMLVGEPQILGQVKESYKYSIENEATGIILNRLFQYAFSVAKKVRSSTNIGSLAVSVGYLIIKLSKSIFDDLSNRNALLVGTGEMAEIAARNLIDSGIKNLYIAGRSYENSEALSQKLHGTTIKLEEIYYKLTDVDIVITATGSNDFIFKPDRVLQAVRIRRNELMFFVDIAVPRDVDPRVNDIPSVYLYDIDDLQNVLDQNIHKRKERAKDAERIVEGHSAKFINWVSGLKSFPTIRKLKNRMDEIKQTELEWAYGKLGTIDQKQKDIISNLVERIIDKVMHGPVSGLKKEASTPIGMLYSDTIQKLYNLEEESQDLEVSQDDNVKSWN